MHRTALTASTHDFTSRALIRARGVGTHADASGPAYEPALASGAFGARWMRMFERAPESPTGAGRVGLSVQECTVLPGSGHLDFGTTRSRTDRTWPGTDRLCRASPAEGHPEDPLQPLRCRRGFVERFACAAAAPNDLRVSS